jgi:cell division protein FtsQ
LLAATALAGISLYALHEAEGLLMRDSRFTFAGPQEAGEESHNLRIEGLLHTSRAAVCKVFEPDYGKSVYLTPVERRRLSLQALNWVRNAVVTRVWPNEIHVRLIERTPVAFLHTSNQDEAQAGRPVLIDQEGVLLEIDNPSQFRLPVLTGIRRNHSESDRRIRVRRMLRLVEEVGARAEQMSEVNASDPENLKVTVSMNGRAVVLMVGNRRFSQRLENFYRHYHEIRVHAPDATVFDLRLEDRITVVPGPSDEILPAPGDTAKGGNVGE